MSEVGQETKKIFCNACNVFTNHLLRARYCRTPWLRTEGHYAPEDFEWRTSIWSCAGCEESTVERVGLTCGEEEEDMIEYFPARQYDSVRTKPFQNLTPDLGRLYHEVVSCYNGGFLLLCTIGLRALVEGICANKEITGRNLEEKINGLIKFVPNLNLIEALQACRFAGNDAAHRLEALTRDEVRDAIELIEDLLNFLYHLDYKALQVRNTSKKTIFRSGKLGPVQ